MDVRVLEMGSNANISSSKNTCLVVLFFILLCFKIVVIADSLYEFFINLSLKISFTKSEFEPVQIIIKL